MLFLAALGVIPAYGFFSGAFDRHVQNLNRKQEEDYGRSRKTVETALQNEYSEESIGPAGVAKLPKALLLGRYGPSPFVASWRPRNPGGLGTIWNLVLAVLIFGFGIAVGLVFQAARRLLGRGQELPSDLAEAGSKEAEAELRQKRILWVGPWEGEDFPTFSRDSRVRRFSLDELLRMEEVELRNTLGGAHNIDCLLISDFDTDWLDRNANVQREAFLRTLLGHWERGIWLVSELAPEEFELPPPDPSKGATDLSLTERLQTDFTLIHPSDRPQLVREIANRQPQRIWRSLTYQERWGLEQITSHGFLHPAMRSTVENLRRYGLLTSGLLPEIQEESFAAFVRQRLASRKITVALPVPGVWRTARNIITAWLLVLLAFLWFTQAEMFQKLATAVGAVPVVLTGILALGSFFRRPGTGGST